MSRFALLLLLPLGLALHACAGGTEAGDTETSAESAAREEPPRNVRVLEVNPLDLEEFLVITGAMRPLHGTDISTEEAGIVETITREKGTPIGEDEIVVMLDRDLLGAELNSAQANLALMQYDAERTQTLFENNSVSRHEMLTTKTQRDQAKAAAEIARLRYDRAAIKAPFGGIVADRYVEPGELVGPGQMVARVVDPYTLKLVGGVTEREVRYIEEGAPAVVSFDGHDEIARGEVAFIAFEASPTTGKFTVEIHVDNSALKWRAGVVGRAKVLKKIHQNVVAIPRDALVQRPRGTAAYVVKGNQAEERILDVGADQGNMVVIHAGLSPKDMLVVRGQRELADGSKVRIQERADQPDGSIARDPDVVKQSGGETAETDLPPVKGSPEDISGGQR